jgi:hypothetical protein
MRPSEHAAGDACLDAETLAAWAEGTVSGEAAAAIETHLADCARCQSMMAAFARSEPAGIAAAGRAGTATPGAVIPFRPRSPIRWLVPVAAGAAAASLLIWTAWPRSSGPITPAEQTMAKAESNLEPAPTPMTGRTEPVAPQPGPPATLASPKPRQETAADARMSRKLEPAAAPTTPPKFAATPPARLPAGAAVPPPTPVAPVSARGAVVRTDTPPVSQTVGADFIQTLPKSDRNALNFLVFLPGTVEFRALDARSSTVTGLGRGGAAGGRSAAAAERVATPTILWRVLPSGEVGKSIDGGKSWNPIVIDPPAWITNGAAPSPVVCWLVGRGGTVLLSTDGTRFTRVTFPQTVDLRSVAAIDANQATVTTADGRVFTTSDGGKTWR